MEAYKIEIEWRLDNGYLDTTSLIYRLTRKYFLNYRIFHKEIDAHDWISKIINERL